MNGIKSVPPPDLPGPEAFEDPWESRSAKMPPPPSPPPPPPTPRPPDDDDLDLAKTQKIERADPQILEEIERAEAAARAAAESTPPPAIPSLSESSDGDRRSTVGARKRRNRKGKRRMVKIPDDSVPQTPTPPAVAAMHDGADHGESLDALRESDDFDDVTRPTEPHERSPHDPSPLIEPLDEDEVNGVGTRQSAPGVFTDDAAIMVLRPIQIVSDLPAVEPEAVEIEPEPESMPKAPPTPPPARVDHGDHATESRRLPPPRHHDEPANLDAIEEIVPDRMSLPAMSPEAAEQIAGGEFGGKKRPLPPPRTIGVADATGQQQSVNAEDLARMALEAPASSDALSAAERDLALAEARAREATAKAVELEAKARAAEAAAVAAKQKAKKQPWWVDMFEGDLVRTLDNPKKHDVEKEATFIEKSLRLEKGARVLDLACGTGVHAVELSSRGYQVVGVDISKTMLDLAQKYNVQRNTSVSFIPGDMRQLNLEGVFDAIYCWGASFGFFDDPTNAQVLERIARALRPGGTFALDVPNRDYIAPRSPSMAWFDKNGCVCMDEMRFDFYSSRLINKRMVLFDTGKSREIESNMRLYTLHELGRLLHKVGFRVLEVSGHRAHRGAYFGSESPRTIVTSRRPEDESEAATELPPT